MIRLSNDNYLEIFNHFELPDDLAERLMVVSRLATLFCELQHTLLEVTQSEFKNVRKGK